jgi:integrase
LLCGLRRGELLALKWEDLDFDAGTLAVHRALERIGVRLEFVEPKSRSGRRVLPLAQPIIKALETITRGRALFGKPLEQHTTIMDLSSQIALAGRSNRALSIVNSRAH